MNPKTGQNIWPQDGVRFNDNEQSITTVARGLYPTKEWIDDRKIYFKRKLMGK